MVWDFSLPTSSVISVPRAGNGQLTGSCLPLPAACVILVFLRPIRNAFQSGSMNHS